MLHIYIDIYIFTLMNSRNQHTIANQLYPNKFFKKENKTNIEGDRGHGVKVVDKD